MIATESSTGNPGRDPIRERGHDCYDTPPEAVYALIKAEQLPHRIWEPAAGHGAIVKVLRQNGHHVFASDLVDYGETDQASGRDFLMELWAPLGCEAIVTNPPYALADQFVRHALTLCPKVIMLLRLAALEGSSRSDVLDGPLARVYLFKNRLPRMHRAGWTGPKASSSIAFAWFVFLRDHLPGQTIILRRISWEKE